MSTRLSEPPDEPQPQLAAILFSSQSTDDVLHTMARLAQTTVPGCDAASVTLIVGGTPHTPVASHQLADTVDGHQYGSGEGPCLDAIRVQHIVQVRDYDTDGRKWPTFTPLAVAEGVRSSLSLPMFAGDEVVGALNLYATAPKAFTYAEPIGEMFARQAGITLANATAFDRVARLAADLSAALEHRDVIGQAKGMLMAQHRIGPDAAFTLLREASQRSNVKLYDVARQLIEHHLPLGDRRS